MRRYSFVLVFLSWLYACTGGEKKADAEPARLTPQYFYYPRANVYFDTANKEYLFLGSDTSNWQMAKQIPAVVQALMDKNVFIQNPATPVWKDNDNHRLVYSALLYATANDTTERKVQKPVIRQKTGIDSSKLARKERKGIRRFFDKIFGGLKKEKKAKETGAEQ